MHRAALASTAAVVRRPAAAAAPTRAFGAWKAAAAARRGVSSTAPLASVAEQQPGATGFAPPVSRGTAAGTREGSQGAWRARRQIVEAGVDYPRLLAVLGEQDLAQLDPHNAAIAVGRLAQAATAHGTEATGAIALDARFQRLVQALLADGGRVLSAMPPQQLAGVVEGLAVFGVKLPGL